MYECLYIHTQPHTHTHTHTPFAAHLEVGYTADEISKQLIIYMVKCVLHIFPEALNIIILNVWTTNNVLKFVDPDTQKEILRITHTHTHTHAHTHTHTRTHTHIIILNVWSTYNVLKFVDPDTYTKKISKNSIFSLSFSL